MELTLEEVKQRLGVEDARELARIGALLMNAYVSPRKSVSSAENGRKGGRPAKPKPVETNVPKRGRGRPKKQDALTTAQAAAASHNGTGGAE